MVGSNEAVRGIGAAISDLEGPGGVIPASVVRVRYAVPWGVNGRLRSRSSMWRVDDELDCLVEEHCP